MGTLTDNKNGTISDDTGRVWLKYAGGFVGTLAAAKNWAASLGDGKFGLTDGSQPGNWSLPTKDYFAAISSAPDVPGVQNAAGDGAWEENDPFLVIRPGPPRYWTGDSSKEAKNADGVPFTDRYFTIDPRTGDTPVAIGSKSHHWAIAVRNYEHVTP